MGTRKKNSLNNHESNENCPKCGASIVGSAFCPDCGAKTRSVSTDEKRARLAGKSASAGRTGLYVGIAAVVLVAAAIAFSMIRQPTGTQRDIAALTASAGAGPGQAAAQRVEVALADLADGKAHHYAWKSPEGKQIKFFALRSADGVIRAAFDACDVCWAEHKGYRQEGNYMVCRNCGQRFESTRVNEIRGGCNPSPLERSIQGGKLVIAAADLQAGARYF